MFAIVDCNNFYASCERVFNPRLLNQPIIVLSNNDGCVIARSNEAKSLDIKMGQPFFEIKRLCQLKGIHVFSSNYALYGDMSNRVMSVLEESWPEVDVYSIDEAFLKLDGLSESGMVAFCHQLHEKVLRYTGIPVSIGVGKTKTLAKLANHIAKKDLKRPYFNITGEEQWLYQKHVSDVWGIGKQWSNKLMQRGIHTAGDLVVFQICFHTFLSNSKRLMKRPMTMSCIHSDFEKQIVRLAKRLIRVRKVKNLRSIFCVFRLPSSCFS